MILKMYLYLCICCALLITSAKSGNSTSELSNNKTSSDAVKNDLPSKTPILSEGGGKLSPSTPYLSLPKEKPNSLITLEEEVSKTKEKSVVGRKGVELEADEINTLKDDSSNKPKKLIPDTKSITKTPTSDKNEPINMPKELKSDVNLKNISTISNVTETPKKPTILSYEALANMEKQIQSDKSKLSVLPSTKMSMASSQIPSPNQDSIKKVYPSKANSSHPGMIMPIVITILVVPMFAVVGYFALKRGQEAWKNRHYKRMDFLLDGMYND